MTYVPAMTAGRRLYERWLCLRDVSPDDLWDHLDEEERLAWERLVPEGTVPVFLTRSQMMQLLPVRASVVNDCWLWEGPFVKGYGLKRVDGTYVRAHRWVYELFVAPLEKGQQVHHKCERPPCVNPDHLEAVDARDHHARHHPPTRGSSAFRGVGWYAPRNKWRVQVRDSEGKDHHGGLFDDELEAAYAAQALRNEVLPGSQPDPLLADSALKEAEGK